ncbi:PAS domain-containing protein [Pedobacter aquatilis]|uniref:PAS domain-containing protein n=1 Tax=Pedobacter aquatilis TaxID=351343 RepID=UPI00292D91A2|nr:PAS domain-containing protein [Pedobacter aquatilis]
MEGIEEERIPEDDELARLAALEHYRIVGTPPDAAFDELAKLATRIFNVPIALICFIAKDTVYYKSNIGFEGQLSQLRSESLCDRAMQAEGVTIIEELLNDPDFANNEHGIRFYAAAPLVALSGYRIGTICIMDYKPNTFDHNQSEILSGLAKIVMDRTELRLDALDDAMLKKQNRYIISFNKQISDRNSDLMAYQEQVSQANNLLESVLDSYERLFKDTPIAIGICSGGTKEIWQANDALNALFVIEGQTAIGQKLNALITDADGKDFLNLLDKVYQERKAHHSSGVKLKINDDGNSRSIYANLSLQPVARMGDEPDNIMFIIADVTEQVVAKQLTQQSNNVLMNAIEAAGMGYTVVEFHTGLMDSNNQLKSNYGYKADENFTYPDLLETILPKYKQTIKAAVQQALDAKSIYRAEYEVKWRDGSIHWIRGFGKPIYDENGKPTHIIGLNKIIKGPDSPDE